jgi:hypothetical protein
VVMARMLADVRRDKIKRCCSHCGFPDGQYMRGGRKNPRFRKLARAADKASWRKERSDG